MENQLSDSQYFHEQLFKQFDSWQKSQKLRDFITAKRASVKGEDISDWETRVIRLADYYDPFSSVNLTESEQFKQEKDELFNQLADLNEQFNLIDIGLSEYKKSFC